MRAHLAELRIIGTAGMTSIAKLIAILRDEEDRCFPSAARSALIEMAVRIEKLTIRINRLDTQIVNAVKQMIPPDD